MKAMVLRLSPGATTMIKTDHAHVPELRGDNEDLRSGRGDAGPGILSGVKRNSPNPQPLPPPL